MTIFAVHEAYLTGLVNFAAQGRNVSRVVSVASFFISRVDTAVDNRLAYLGNTNSQGKIGIANAKAAYGPFHQIFSGERLNALARKGTRAIIGAQLGSKVAGCISQDMLERTLGVLFILVAAATLAEVIL